MKFTLATLSFILALTIAPVGLSAELKETPIDKSALELGEAKDDDQLSPEEKLKREIEARIKILNDVISLSIKEIDGQGERLEKLPKFEDKSREKELRDYFLVNLEHYKIYFEAQSQKLEELIKFKDEEPERLNNELKNLAREIKEYRDQAYNPGILKTVEFTLLFYTENVLKVAKTRLDKISSDVKKLEKLGLVDKGYNKTSLERAARLINQAQEFHAEAKKIILAPEEKEVVKEKTDKDTKPKPTSKELTEKSLFNIKTSYDIFLKISKDIRKTLGID